ncbi:small subunit ribosomal protein S21 [Zhouia amylolytica]|uniref:Small ribosomal subunit protein bS21 n=2 Tax=Zhouia amylolytica TaxID=376730 RepID=W2UP02_9FLAO|nr:30S ribosomal protein S21 [Zhouia amylolytica]ETN95072.1 ribosomal protein S21 [Zhouia amylolytica AD3]MCQ0110659.1 30S ribosomal protein S21 [Zhouia amylolytica]SFS62940.1 small subunit ribosomal protein S21 [Zhouia amylolytica]
MLIIPIKQGESIERALKRYKQKYRKTQQLKNLRDNQHFTKKSQIRREEVAKAAYKQEWAKKNED